MQIIRDKPITINDGEPVERKYTIQYTAEELDKIQRDFVTQMDKYFDRVNDRILNTLEKIEKEAKVL